MELDNLKPLFRENLEQPVLLRKAGQLERMLKRDTGSPVSALKKNLRLELLIGTVFFAFPAYILIRYSDSYLMIYALVLVIVAAIFIINIIRILKAINRYEKAANAIKQHLHLLTIILKNFSRLYIQSTILVVPLFFLTASVLIHLGNQEKDPLLFLMPSTNTLLIYISLFIGWSFSMYFFSRWYVAKLYGKHLAQLLNKLAELNTNE